MEQMYSDIISFQYFIVVFCSFPAGIMFFLMLFCSALTYALTKNKIGFEEGLGVVCVCVLILGHVRIITLSLHGVTGALFYYIICLLFRTILNYSIGKKHLIPKMLEAFIYSDKNKHLTTAIFY